MKLSEFWNINEKAVREGDIPVNKLTGATDT